MDGKHPKKYAPKKVFVLENNNYIEITAVELDERRSKDSSYQNKWFIPIHGMLMEVNEAVYREFYREEERQKYQRKQAEDMGEISYDMLTTDEMNGADILRDGALTVEEIVEIKLMVEKLRKSLALLAEDEWRLIDAIYFKGMSERQWSAISGVPQTTIGYQKRKILALLKKSLEKL